MKKKSVCERELMGVSYCYLLSLDKLLLDEETLEGVDLENGERDKGGNGEEGEPHHPGVGLLVKRAHLFLPDLHLINHTVNSGSTIKDLADLNLKRLQILTLRNVAGVVDTIFFFFF